MEFLNINGTISIKPDWANISGAVLKAGTPLSVTGVVANNANAIGLLADEAHKGDGEVNVVYAGLVDIGEVEASYGDSLADDCKAALKGITIVDTSGSPIVPSGGGGGTQILYFSTDPLGVFNTAADFSGDTVTAANACSALLANPAAYCFADADAWYAPAFALVTANNIVITLFSVLNGVLQGEVANISVEYPEESSVTPFAISGGVGEEP